MGMMLTPEGLVVGMIPEQADKPKEESAEQPKKPGRPKKTK